MLGKISNLPGIYTVYIFQSSTSVPHYIVCHYVHMVDDDTRMILDELAFVPWLLPGLMKKKAWGGKESFQEFSFDNFTPTINNPSLKFMVSIQGSPSLRVHCMKKYTYQNAAKHGYIRSSFFMKVYSTLSDTHIYCTSAKFGTHQTMSKKKLTIILVHFSWHFWMVVFSHQNH